MNGKSDSPTPEKQGRRCKHPNARVTDLFWMRHTARIDCPDCERLFAVPRSPWASRHACRRVHQAPKWAQKLIDAARLALIERLMESDPSPETEEGQRLTMLADEQVEAERGIFP